MPSISKYVIVVLLVLLGLASVGGYFLFKDNKKLDEKVITTKVENATLTDTVEKQVESKKIDEKAQDDVQVNTDTAVTKTEAIVHNTVVKEKAVVAKYDALPKTPENKAAKIDETSQIRVSSMWEQFCSTGNSYAACMATGGK